MNSAIVPSFSLAGDSRETLRVSSVGGAKRRMRGMVQHMKWQPLNSLNQTPHPSRDQEVAIHLLPQGEKVA